MVKKNEKLFKKHSDKFTTKFDEIELVETEDKPEIERQPEGVVRKKFKEPVYVTDGMDYVRTEPRETDGVPFIGFVKLTDGSENEVEYSNDLLNRVLLEGDEISKKEYNNNKPRKLNQDIF